MIPILCIYLTPHNNMLVYDRMVDRLNGIDSFFNTEYNVCGINSNTNDNPVISGNTSNNDIIYWIGIYVGFTCKIEKQNLNNIDFGESLYGIYSHICSHSAEVL